MLGSTVCRQCKQQVAALAVTDEEKAAMMELSNSEEELAAERDRKVTC